jgi:Putative peptidoglycan binding domain/N-acetylmuramoyl-L-alanine amidase
MAVTRAWRGSPHYNSGGLNRRVIAFHTTEGATTCESLANWLTNPSSKVSYHFAVDMSHGDNWVMQYVRDGDRAWAQASYNSQALSICFCTPSGAASGWSRSTWLSKGAMLTAAARLAGELSRQFGIPLVGLNNSQAQGSSRGLCEHKNFGSAGGGHHDCGPGFPMDEIIKRAGGSASAPAPPSGGQPGTKAPPMPADSQPWFGRDARSRSSGVRTWQQQMKNRGWKIGVDGIFGNESDGVCRKFQAEKGLAVDGKVGAQTWDRTWSAPVT